MKYHSGEASLLHSSQFHFLQSSSRPQKYGAAGNHTVIINSKFEADLGYDVCTWGFSARITKPTDCICPLAFKPLISNKPFGFV